MYTAEQFSKHRHILNTYTYATKKEYVPSNSGTNLPVCFFNSKSLIKYEEQSHSSKADSRSASQQLPRALENQKVSYRVHKSL
jgi:hypothetical protein